MKKFYLLKCIFYKVHWYLAAVYKTLNVFFLYNINLFYFFEKFYTTIMLTILFIVFIMDITETFDLILLNLKNKLLIYIVRINFSSFSKNFICSIILLSYPLSTIFLTLTNHCNYFVNLFIITVCCFNYKISLHVGLDVFNYGIHFWCYTIIINLDNCCIFSKSQLK